MGLATDPNNLAALELDLRQKAARAESLEQLTSVWLWASQEKELPLPFLFEIGDRFADIGAWPEAREVAARGIKEKPNDFEWHRKMGWCLRNIGELEYGNAQYHFERALILNPGDIESIGMMAGIKKRQRKYSEAKDLYGRGLAISPSSTYMMVNRAAMTLLTELSSNNTLENATAQYNELRQILSSKVDADNNPWDAAILGEAAFVLGDKAEACKYFNAASNLANDPTVLRSPKEQIQLFAEHGFRRDDAKSVLSVLDELVDTKVQSRAIPTLNKQSLPATHIPVIIHLSDIHFGYRPASGGGTKRMHRFDSGDYSRPLLEQLVEELSGKNWEQRYGIRPKIIVASGDFTYMASASEFDEALLFFKGLSRELALPEENFVFCPGNHDVNWADCRIDPLRRFDNYLSFLVKFYGEEGFRKIYPRITWDLRVNSQRPSPADLISANFWRNTNIVVCSFNSCVYETEQHHYGFVSLVQQRNMTKLLASRNIPDDALRIAVIHHHMHPYPEFVDARPSEGHWVDLSTIRDGGLFESYLEKHRFDMILHGHKHQPQLRVTSVRDNDTEEEVKNIIVCGAGSCGVSADELPHSVSNHFQILDLKSTRRLPGVELATLEWREISTRPGAEWVSTKIWRIPG